MRPTTELTSPPVSLAVVEPQFTASRLAPEVLVATGEGSIEVVDTGTSQDMVRTHTHTHTQTYALVNLISYGAQGITNGPFLKMTVAPTGRMVAAYMASGSLWVSGLDFRRT